MHEMRILSVDIGIRNFAFTVYCTVECRFILFRVLDLGKVKDYVAEMRELSSTEPFVSAGVILIERQMRSCMRTMAVSLRAFNYDRAVMVSPQSVKRHFRTSMKKHGANKKAGVVVARQYLGVKMLSQFNDMKKQDDIADCVLQTHWYIRNGVSLKAAQNEHVRNSR